MRTHASINNAHYELTVTLSSEDLEPFRIKALQALAKDLKISGFRNGKAPANVVERHVDPNALAQQTLDTAIRFYVSSSFDDDFAPLSAPQVKVMAYVPGEMAVFQVDADVFPPKMKLGRYEKLTVPYRLSIVKDTDVDDVLRRIADSFATTNVVKRAAEKNDEVIIDFTGKKDQVAFKGGSAKDYHLVLGSKSFIPGFEDGVIGHVAGDKFDLNLTFPEAYGDADLAGAKVVFTVLVKQVNAIVKPPIDDALAKKAGDFATLDALKVDIRTNLELEAQRSADDTYKNALMDKIIADSEFDTPMVVVGEEAERAKADLLKNLEFRHQTFDGFLQHNHFSREQWESENKNRAIANVRASLVAKKLVDELKITVPEAQIQHELTVLKQSYGKNPDALKHFESPQAHTEIAHRLCIDAMLNKLAELNRPYAKIEGPDTKAKKSSAHAKKSSAKTAKSSAKTEQPKTKTKQSRAKTKKSSAKN